MVNIAEGREEKKLIVRKIPANHSRQSSGDCDYCFVCFRATYNVRMYNESVDSIEDYSVMQQQSWAFSYECNIPCSYS